MQLFDPKMNNKIEYTLNNTETVHLVSYSATFYRIF